MATVIHSIFMAIYIFKINPNLATELQQRAAIVDN
jgi:hypothetical protein